MCKQVSSSQVETLKFLSEVKLFKRLPAEQRPLLASVCKDAVFDVGQVIIKQGDDGDAFFVIREGIACVAVGGKPVARLKEGDYFGEASLLYDEPRSATITAETGLSALKILRHEFQSLDLHKKLNFPNRKAVGGGGKKGKKKKDKGRNLGSASERVRQSIEQAGSKSPAEQKFIKEAIKTNAHLQVMVDLSENTLKLLVDAAVKREVPASTQVITEGSEDADFFYIVNKGSFEVQIGQASSDALQRQNLPIIAAGNTFGELALLYVAPRAATVIAKEDSEVWMIERENFKAALEVAAGDTTKQYVAYLDKVEVLAPLSKEQKQAVAESMVEMAFQEGESVIEEGEVGSTFYILFEGSVKVMKGGQEQTVMVATQNEVQMFGERALMKDEPRAATVVVSSPSARALVMDRDSFNMLLGPLDEIKKWAGKPVEKTLSMMGPRKSEIPTVFLKDLKKKGLLGCGGFGMVDLVEHTPTQQFYALKALSKGYIVESEMQKSVLAEKNIQLQCDSKFIIKLYETFNEPQNLLLLLELALGGDLYGVYHKKGLSGSEKHARFYVAGVVLALEHLHKKKILYRDLKPENLLLTETGWIKLTDMGLAKVVVGRTYTTCGTPDYFAPEVIASKGYQHSVDWWALGVLTYEFLVGRAPFAASDPMQIFEKVVKGIGKVKFPQTLSGQAKDLIHGLCRKEPRDRLPVKKGGTKNVKKHPWYASFAFDWGAMEALEADPPYVPKLKSKTDASNFTATKDDIPPQVPYEDDGSGWDKDFATST